MKFHLESPPKNMEHAFVHVLGLYLQEDKCGRDSVTKCVKFKL